MENCEEVLKLSTNTSFCEKELTTILDYEEVKKKQNRQHKALSVKKEPIIRF